MSRITTPPSTNPPDESGDGHRLDAVPGDPPVPITVWRTPAGTDQITIPTSLAHRLVAAYSHRGEIVVDATDDRALSSACVGGRRRYRRAVFTSRALLVLGPDDSLAEARPPTQPPVGSLAFDEVPRARRPGAAGDQTPTPPRRPPHVEDPAVGATALVAAGWPLHAVDPVNQARLRCLLGAARTLLRPNGCTVLVVRGRRGVAGAEDFGPLIGAARDAGLGYLQHIVAVHADVAGDQFTYYATDEDLARLFTHPADDAAPDTRDAPPAAVHVRVHADLLVFTAPGGARG